MKKPQVVRNTLFDFSERLVVLRLLAIVPMVVACLITQRRFTESIATSALQPRHRPARQATRPRMTTNL
jgi:hypothetical protein